MKKIVAFLLIFAVGLCAEVVTKTTTQSADGTGSGSTREEAVNNAIIEALGKIGGVKIDSNKLFVTNSVASSDGSFIKDSYSSGISRATNGKIDGFDIVGVREIGGGYEADVTIKKITTSKKYKAPGLDPNNRRKMAILPVFVSQNSYEFLGGFMGSAYIAEPLTQAIINQMTQTRKFTILDRANNSQIYAVEEAIIRSKSAKKDEILKLGNVLGADYLYVVNVSDFGVLKDGASLTNKNAAKLKATIDYQIVTMATRQIKFSKTKNFNFNVKGSSNGEILSNLSNKIAQSLTEDIIDNIFPLKIADLVDGEVVLSQSLSVGDVYEVFSLGKKVSDSYTKESVGRVENLVGKIKIIRQTPKMSYGQIIEGSAKKGDICRKVGFGGGEGKDTAVKMEPGGGVVLPFWV